MAEGTLSIGNVEIIELTDAHVRFRCRCDSSSPG